MTGSYVYEVPKEKEMACRKAASEIVKLGTILDRVPGELGTLTDLLLFLGLSFFIFEVRV